MTPESFVSKLNVAVVEENNAIYRALLLNTDPSGASRQLLSSAHAPRSR